MKNWTKEITEKIKGWKKIVILGIGNNEKGDDGVGILCAKKLKKLLIKNTNILVINGGNIPESWTGKIRSFSPDWTILIDACKKGEKPGSIFIIKKNEISYTDISTHRIPLSMLVSYLEDEINTKTLFIGVEPENMENEKLSESVKTSAEKIIEFLSKYLNPLKFRHKE